MKTICLTLISLIFASLSFGATITSSQSGAWSAGSTWVGGVAPSAGDDVVIQDGDDITVTSTTTCNSLLINANSNLTTFTVNSGVTLTTGSFDTRGTANTQTITIENNGNISCTGNLYFYDNKFSSHTINVNGSGKMTVNGRLELNANAGNTVNLNSYVNSTFQFYLFSGFNGNLVVNVSDTTEINAAIILQSAYGSSTSDKVQLNIDNSSAVLWLNGIVSWNFYNFGGEMTNSSSGGLVLSSRRQNFNSDSRLQFGTFALDASTTLTGALEFANGCGFKVLSGTTINYGTRNIEVPGHLDVDGTLTGTTGTIVMNGSTAQTLDLSSATTFANFQMANTSGGVSLVGDTVRISTLVSFDATGTTALTTNGKLKLLDQGSGMANLGNINNHTISGSIACQFKTGTLTDIGYRHISIPVSGVTISDIQHDAASNPGGIETYGFTGSNTPSAGGLSSTYTYDNGSVTGDFDDGWVAATNTSNSLGYLQATVNYIGPGSTGGKSNYYFEVEGTPNTGDVKINSTEGANMSYDAGNAADNNYNWCLVGNPYPSAVTWSSVTRSNVEATAYVFSEDGSGYTAVTTIAPFQGIWVRTSGSSADLTFNEDDKSTTQTAFVKSSEHEDGLTVKIHSEHTTKYSIAHLKLKSNANDGYVEEEDARRLLNPWPWPNVALMSTDDEALQISKIPGNKTKISIPLYATTYVGGKHELKFENIDKVDGCVVLEDKELGKMIFLNEDTDSYSFDLSEKYNQVRFVLHVYKMSLNEVSTINSSCFGTNDGSASIELSDLGSTYMVDWADNKGNTISSKFSTEGTQSISNLAPGKYEVSMINHGLRCASTTKYFTIMEPGKMSASFALPQDVYSNEPVSFENKCEGMIKDYFWNFGDNNSSFARNPKHTFEKAGTYEVSLTVGNGNSDCDVTRVQSVEVKQGTVSMNEVASSATRIILDDNLIRITGSKTFDSYRISDLTGKVITSGSLEEDQEFTWNSDVEGIFILQLTNQVNETYTQKIFR